MDKKVAATLGGAEGVTTLLEALAKSVGQAKKKRRAGVTVAGCSYRHPITIASSNGTHTSASP